ncbi:MAG TPA: hypothetical protein EYP31_03900 [Roseibacterium sp.]|nr:hypothetical protein [Roseibacterium sp.]
MAKDHFEAALRDAQETDDWSVVISLYIDAARGSATDSAKDSPDSATDSASSGEAFYLTHAFVHALEAGDPRASGLRAQLITLGAEKDDIAV